MSHLWEGPGSPRPLGRGYLQAAASGLKSRINGVQPNCVGLGKSSSLWTESSFRNGGSDDSYLVGLFLELNEAKHIMLWI